MSRDVSDRVQDSLRHSRALAQVARDILGDPNAADDAVQAAWLAALERPPRQLSFRWLSQVVRTRSLDERRRQRNSRDWTQLSSGDAEPAATPLLSAADRARSLGAYSDLAQAMQRLPDAQSEALYLRYFEDQSPADIARDLRCPLETVKTRLARGLRSLRRELTGTEEARGALLLLALSAHRPPPPAAALAASAAGALLMNKWIPAVSIVLLALLGARMLSDDGTREPGSTGPIRLEGRTELAGRAQPMGSAPASSTRSTPVGLGAQDPVHAPANDGVDARTWSLDLKVLYADRSPATGTTVRLHRSTGNGPQQAMAAYPVGADGRVLVEGLRPGQWRLTSSAWGSLELDLDGSFEPVVTRTLWIRAGTPVTGVVRNSDGHPVPFAELWTVRGEEAHGSSNPVGRADETGSYALRDLPQLGFLGARAAGFAPSDLVEIEHLSVNAEGAASADFRLSPGGATVSGRVLDPELRPVPGARLFLGGADPLRGLDPQDRVTWGATFVETGEDGVFEVASLEPGTIHVACSAPGLANWLGSLTTGPAGRETLEIRLERGATLAGRVVDEGGRVLPGAQVLASPCKIDEGPLAFGYTLLHLPFGHPYAVADANGHYELQHVPSGPVQFYCLKAVTNSPTNNTRFAVRSCTLEPGESATWNPVLEKGPTIRGSLTYADQSPAKKSTLMLLDEATDEMRFANTDDRGLFEATNLSGLRYTLIALFELEGGDRETVTAEDVAPGAVPVHLAASQALPPGAAGALASEAVEPGSIEGTISDPHGRLRQKVSVVLWQEGPGEVAQSPVTGRTFAFDRVRPGRYRVRVYSGVDRILTSAAFDVAPGAIIPLDPLVTEAAGAAHLFHLRRAPEAVGLPVELILRPQNGFGGGLLRAAGSTGSLTATNLTPGRYSVLLRGDGVAEHRAMFSVDANSTGETQLDIARGFRVTIQVRYDPSLGFSPAASAIALSAVQPGESILLQRWSIRSGDTLGRYALDATLTPGDWTLRAEQDGQLLREVPMRVLEGGEQQAVELDLRMSMGR